jgi:transposase
MLRPMSIEPVPSEMARVAYAAFPKRHKYLRLADGLVALFTDDAFLALFPRHGQPAPPPWRLALVTLLQFAEGLWDRQAEHAVRSRIDWQDVVRPELTDPGFDASVLSEFRTRLIAGAAESLLFETLLTCCRNRQLVKARGRQRTDSTHILAAVRALNRSVVGSSSLPRTGRSSRPAPLFLGEHGCDDGLAVRTTAPVAWSREQYGHCTRTGISRRQNATAAKGLVVAKCT